MANLLSRNNKVGIVDDKYSKIPPSTSVHRDKHYIRNSVSEGLCEYEVGEEWLLCIG